MTRNKTVEFFDEQFQRQTRAAEYVLNPFEVLALDYLRGEVLDLGCGLGNLSLEAGRRGHRVTALDGSAVAVARINDDARREGLDVSARQTDIGPRSIDRCYDTIVAIGLLMFFRREQALELLAVLQGHVNPHGRAVINILVEGTTFTGMFDGDNYVLLAVPELEACFAGWEILVSQPASFPAPEGTTKEFVTLIAAKPGD